MAKNTIVVALDGSELSEGVLPYAVAIAKAREAGLLLVTSWEGAERDVASMLPSVAQDLRVEGNKFFNEYLEGVAKRISGDVAVTTVVVNDRPADAVQSVVNSHEGAVLALATHGRSGPSRWLYGSVANELIHEATTDTLVIGPKVLETNRTADIRKVLVPLDGSELAERALEPALAIAEKAGAKVTVAQAVDTPAAAMPFAITPVYVPEVEEQVVEAAKSYIADVKERCGGKPSGLVVRGRPSDVLVGLVEQQEIDLVVMASHSRAGVVRAFLGSVADRMLQCAAPVLLVRPPAA